MRWLRLTLALMLLAATRPTLAAALARVAWRFRARGWYRQPPFLPVPDPTYIRWRMYTAYGDAEAVPPTADIARYALWAARYPR